MTSRALAISNGEADLTDGFKTVASDAGSLPRGGTPGAAQSEREKRGPRHSEPVSQVALDGPGWSRHRIGQDDGSAPASKIVEAWGPTSEADGPGAGLPMPSLRLSPTSNYLTERGTVGMTNTNDEPPDGSL